MCRAEKKKKKKRQRYLGKVDKEDLTLKGQDRRRKAVALSQVG